MAKQGRRGVIRWTGLRGRDGSTPAQDLPPTFASDATNVELHRCGLARKRAGTESVSLTGLTWASTEDLQRLFRHLPGADATTAEMWATGETADNFGRLAGGTTWAVVTPSPADSIVCNTVRTVSFNGKLFIFGNSNTNRTHVWDGTTLRRAGMLAPAAATVADTGAGAYAQVLRYYKIKFLRISGSTIISQSELSASVSHTPGVGVAAARVTKPATISEGETHWRVYGSADDTEYFLVSGDIAVGTTTYDDTATVANYSAGTAAPIVGLYKTQPSAKFAVAAGPRIVMIGAWETTATGSQTTPKVARAWWTLPLGALSTTGEDEAIADTEDPIYGKQYTDLGEYAAQGEPTGIGLGPNGVIYVFFYRAIWILFPQNDLTVPYVARELSSTVGCVRHETICNGVDAVGAPATYFQSAEGGYRIVNVTQLQFLGEDVADQSMISASDRDSVHAVFYEEKQQYWPFSPLIAAGGGTTGNFRLSFDAQLGFYESDLNRVRGGWARHTINSSSTNGAQASVMFSRTLGASMSLDLVPYIACGNTLHRCDTGTTDSGTNFQATIDSPVFMPGGYAQRFKSARAHLLARTASGVTLTLSIFVDFQSTASATPTATLTAGTGINIQAGTAAAATTEQGVIAPFPVDLAQALAVKVRIGDGSASAAAWILDGIELAYELEEDVAA